MAEPLYFIERMTERKAGEKMNEGKTKRKNIILTLFHHVQILRQLFCTLFHNIDRNKDCKCSHIVIPSMILYLKFTLFLFS